MILVNNTLPDKSPVCCFVDTSEVGVVVSGVELFTISAGVVVPGEVSDVSAKDVL